MKDEVLTNFGAAPFLFDIRGFQTESLLDEFREVSQVNAETPVIFESVKAYLVHYAFVETLQALEGAEEKDAKKESLNGSPMLTESDKKARRK